MSHEEFAMNQDPRALLEPEMMESAGCGCEGPEEQSTGLSRRALVRGASGLLVTGGLVAAGTIPAMAATSQNGWPAGTTKQISISALNVGAASFAPGVRSGDVHTILGYVARRFNNEVEALVKGWCWGYAYREIRGGSTSLSNHASGTAIDCNAPNHPLGKAGTFSSSQRAKIRSILDACNGVVRWGGDYTNRKDEMHFEINVRPGDARIAPLVKKIGGSPSNPTPALGWPTVKSGASGYRVTAIQHLLRAHGRTLTVTGSFGAETVSKVKAFQTNHKLVADAIVGPKTWTALVIQVRKGSKGEAVVAAQKALTARGYALSADGDFGSITDSKAKAFQKANSLVADGIIGPKTWAALV